MLAPWAADNRVWCLHGQTGVQACFYERGDSFKVADV